jgi:hypothetical protein
MSDPKKIIAFLTFFVASTLFALSASAQSSPPAQQPKIFFDETTHDFGNQLNGVELKHSFTVKNTGKGILTIDNVKASCGCTAAVASSKEISPGSEGKIDVTFKPGKALGAVSKSITVTSNDPEHPTSTLMIKANLETLLDAQPAQISFGQLKRTDNKDQSILLTGKNLEKIKIQSVALKENEQEISAAQPNPPKEAGRPKLKSAKSGLAWKINDSKENEKRKLEIALSLDAKKAGFGQFSDTLVVTTDDSQIPKIEIPITGEITGPLLAEPARAYFSNYVTGEEKSQSLTIKSDDGKMFKILSIVSDNPIIKITNTDNESKAAHSIDLTLSKEAADDQVAALLTIKTDLSEQNELIVPVNGFKKRNAALDQTANSSAKTTSLKSSAPAAVSNHKQEPSKK